MARRKIKNLSGQQHLFEKSLEGDKKLPFQ